MANILVIDDDSMICNTISNVVERMGHSVTCASTLKDGIETAYSGSFDIVFLDVRLPDGNGLDMLPRIQKTPSSPEVIIITGFGDPDGAELAIKSGVWDYIEKPSSIKKITLPLVRALQYREEKAAGKPLMALKREGIVGNSPQMMACLDLLVQAANSDANVLISGETGTGKELFAWAIHSNSSRANKRFVVVDCAALPETLVQSVLFGHEKGAFTGADKSQDGLIKQAHGGTLFLDEVGELPLSIQKAFLRVLQERRFRPVGGDREVESDFRLVAATNQDIEAMVQQGQFREDLLFRLRSLLIKLPSLREHTEDIKELSMHHMAKLCERYGIGTKGFSSDFLNVLTSYDWPGNVRELISALERAIAATRHGSTLFPWHLPTHIRAKVIRSMVDKKAVGKGTQRESADYTVEFSKLRDFRKSAEQNYLQDLIAFTGGNIKQACKISGLSRSRLYSLLKKYHLSNRD